MNEKNSKLSRSAFLLSVGAGGAAGAAALVAKQTSAGGGAERSAGQARRARLSGDRARAELLPHDQV